MDKFTKYALLTMIVIVLIMTFGAYVGATIFRGSMEGTDATVNNMAGESAKSWFGFPFTADAFGQMGEYIGFSLAGVMGGFIVGYCFPTIFSKDKDVLSRREK